MHLHFMRTLISSCLLVAGISIASCLEAQSTLALGDSINGQLERQSSDSLIITLRDGDLARLTVRHQLGLRVDVMKPNRSLLKSLIPAAAEGIHSVGFAAEGGGRYAIVVTNTGDSSARYTVGFKERISLDERTRPASWRDSLHSPTIEGIRKAIVTGDASTEEFWKTVARIGTPIVEPADGKYDLSRFSGVVRTTRETFTSTRRTKYRMVAINPFIESVKVTSGI
jgi:hypothetical protein